MATSTSTGGARRSLGPFAEQDSVSVGVRTFRVSVLSSSVPWTVVQTFKLMTTLHFIYALIMFILFTVNSMFIM